MDSGSGGDRQKEIQISRSDKVENANESVKKDVPKILSSKIRTVIEIMDSGSDGDRLKETQIRKGDNVENIEDSIEENVEYAKEEDVPKILSPEIRDVFHVFASMLDIKSFMKLAMTCKDMYRRCTEDKYITIDVSMKSFFVYDEYDEAIFEIDGLIVTPTSTCSYHSALLKLPCRVKLGFVSFDGCRKASTFAEALQFMKEMGLEIIEKLVIHETFTHFVSIILFAKNFDIREVHVDNRVPLPVLKSILSLDVEKVTFDFFEDANPVDILLDTDSTIPEMVFPRIRSINQDQFMQILSKIRAGPLRRLTLRSNAVNWNDFKKIPYDYDGPLPDERPLLIEGRIYLDTDEYWFLDWQGDVTKCVEDQGNRRTLEIFKCEPWDYPWILRKEEDVMKDLAEKRQRVSCSAEQFKSFSSTFQRFSAGSTEVVPKNRPLYFKLDEKNFWLLDEDDSVMKCYWVSGCAIWKSCSPLLTGYPTVPALDKYLFWRNLQMKNFMEKIFCMDLMEFDGWFEGYEKYDFNYSGDLPSARPLVFESIFDREKRLRVVLFEDRLLQCRYGICDVKLKHCSPWNLPSSFTTAETVKEMILESMRPLFDFGEASKQISYELFREGFEQFKTITGPSQYLPVVYEKMTKKMNGEIFSEGWFCAAKKYIRKVVWNEGRLSVSDAKFYSTPMEFKIQLLRKISMRGIPYVLHLEHKQFLSFLEQFTVVPFDYSGSLMSDSPLAFVKKEIRQRESRRKMARGRCTAEYFRVWFLWEGWRTTYCCWNEEESRAKAAVFQATPDYQAMPPILSSKEYLKILLEGDYDDASRFEWFGRLSDLRVLLEGYKKIPRDYDGPLPDDRPLVLETEDKGVSLLLREDGTVIKCDCSE